MENEKYPYQKNWEDRRRRKLYLILSFIFYIPFMILYGFVSKLILKDFKVADTTILVFGFIIYSTIFAICVVRYNFWKCPQCEKPYIRNWWRSSFLTSKCLHCKLPKYYGSSYFYDYWGTEQGNEFKRKVENKLL